MVDEGQLALQVRSMIGERPAVVALSGGADSAVLAMLAARATSRLRAVHVHHGQPASDELEKAARDVAARLELPITVVTVTVPESGSFETVAREFRVQALADSLGADEVLLLGHTADDQAETVLLRLARGSGPSGLAAMRPQAGYVLRPLLECRRADVRSLARSAGLPFTDDPANLDRRHSRVVVREDLLPALERIQPGATAAMARHARLAAEVDDFVDDLVAGALPGSRVALPVYAVMDGFLRTRALRLLAAASGCPGPGSDALRRMHDVATGRTASAQVAEGFEVVRNGAYLEMARACPVPPEPVDLEAGTTRWAHWRLEITVRSGRPPAWPLHAGRAIVPTTGELQVRAISGDDAHGNRPIVDEMTGLSPGERRCWPVVELDGELVWVPGVRRLQAGWLALEDDRYRWLVADRRDPWTSERS